MLGVYPRMYRTPAGVRPARVLYPRVARPAVLWRSRFEVPSRRGRIASSRIDCEGEPASMSNQAQSSITLRGLHPRRFASPLADRLADGADAEQVADAILAIWLEIDHALHPIIGHRGVAALHARSLKLTAIAHPWLPHSHRGALGAIDPSELKAALIQQPVAEAAEGGNALLHTFREVLASLIGQSLSDRLLRTVWAHAAGSASGQDIPS